LTDEKDSPHGRIFKKPFTLVIPAKAGIQFVKFPSKKQKIFWIPAFAGMTNLKKTRFNVRF